MFSESLDLRKMLKEKTRFSIFSLEIKNKIKWKNFDTLVDVLKEERVQNLTKK